MNTYYKSLNAKEAAEQLKNQKDVKEAYWDTDLNCMVWVTKDGTFRKASIISSDGLMQIEFTNQSDLMRAKNNGHQIII